MTTLNSFFAPSSSSHLIETKRYYSSTLSNSSSSYHLSTLSKPYLNNQNLATKFRQFSPTKAKPSSLTKAVTEEREVTKTQEEEEVKEEDEGINNNNNGVIPSSDRLINAAIVLAAASLAITKLLTIDHDYSHGWTLYEVLRYAPEHSWNAYEETLKTHPVLSKMAISGIVYSMGDWIAQCYEGKLLFDIDRTRMFRSGLVGFTLHGSLSHYYYQFCEVLFPYKEWWVVPVKVAFDQTVWSAVWNSIYFVVLALLRLESPVVIFNELRATFWPMLTAGWKLWPFAHVITYGVVPVEQRLLWVDCIELIWVTILSTYSNEKSEVRISEAPEGESGSPSNNLSKEE